MSFVPVLNGPPYGPPYDVILTRSADGKEVMARTRLSGDMANSAIASICCKLSLQTGSLNPLWELRFFIRVVPIDRGDFDPQEFDDREDAKEYIPEIIRPLVMDIVSAEACRLVDDFEPEGVIITTLETFNGPPEEDSPKWMAKYQLLINRLQSRGYFIERELRSELNQQVWVLTNR